MNWPKAQSPLIQPKARETFGEVKEALKFDFGNMLFVTYQRYRQEGWPEDKAKKMTLELAKSQLERKIEKSISETGEA